MACGMCLAKSLRQLKEGQHRALLTLYLAASNGHPETWMHGIPLMAGMRLCELGVAQWRGPRAERRFRMHPGLSATQRHAIRMALYPRGRPAHAR